MSPIDIALKSLFESDIQFDPLYDQGISVSPNSLKSLSHILPGSIPLYILYTYSTIRITIYLTNTTIVYYYIVYDLHQIYMLIRLRSILDQY